MSGKYVEQTGRPCPFVALHSDNAFASTVAIYVAGDGWRSALGVELLRRRIEEDEAEGLSQVNRVSAAMGDERYRAAIDWARAEETRKSKQKQKRMGDGTRSSQPG